MIYYSGQCPLSGVFSLGVFNVSKIKQKQLNPEVWGPVPSPSLPPRACRVSSRLKNQFHNFFFFFTLHTLFFFHNQNKPRDCSWLVSCSCTSPEREGGPPCLCPPRPPVPGSCAAAGSPAPRPGRAPAGPGAALAPPRAKREAGGVRGAAGPSLTRLRPSLRAGHGEPRRQLAAAPGVGGLPLVEEVRRLRGEDRRPLPALCHGQLLAQPLPQVLLLPGPAGGHRHLLLHQERHDPLQERLHQVRRGATQRLATTALPLSPCLFCPFPPFFSGGQTDWWVPVVRSGGVRWLRIAPSLGAEGRGGAETDVSA